MIRKANKGVSLVEVLIALAIFMLMMIPIVSGLTTGMKNTSSAKDLQYRNEYAQNLMEHVKEVPIEVLKDSKTDYFKNLGATDVTITPATSFSTTYNKSNWNGSTTQCPYEQYDIFGKTYLGNKHTKYSYVIRMSSEVYADKESTGSMNPNNLTSGYVESLDQSKVALISATLGNYDTPAYDALLTRKMAEIRKIRENNNETYDPVNDVKLFKDDMGSRVINISVSGNKSTGYDVICTVYYSDNCSILATSSKTIGKEIGMVEYETYRKHFDSLSNIYLMYNVGVYNGKYTKDYITYDLSCLDDKSKINAFVVQTASDYSTDVVDTNTKKSANWLKGAPADTDVLYREADNGKRDDAALGVSVGMALLSKNLNDDKKQNFNVYYNMIAPSENDYASQADYEAAVAKWKTHAKNTAVNYDAATAQAVGALFNNSSDHVYEQIPNAGGMNQVQKDTRGLYSIKIYIQKGDVTAENLMKGDPILQGTRGGGEID